MSDLVVTVPKRIWTEWIEEGDAAGDPETGTEWAFYLGGHRPPVKPGDRLYIVAHDRLRGYAPVTRLVDAWSRGAHRWGICRKGGAVAITVPEKIPGFRGWRYVWWDRTQEITFPDWRTPACG